MVSDEELMQQRYPGRMVVSYHEVLEFHKGIRGVARAALNGTATQQELDVMHSGQLSVAMLQELAIHFGVVQLRPAR